MSTKVMKSDTKRVLFTDESRVTLDGLDSWGRLVSSKETRIILYFNGNNAEEA